MRFYGIFPAILVWLGLFRVTKEQYQNFDIPESPCPRLFQYKLNGNSYIGEIELPSPPIQHHEVILHVTLSLRVATTVINLNKKN